MSQENVELMHRVMDAFNRRDLDAYLALIDPEVESGPYEVWVQGGDPYRGHVGVRRWWEESFEVLPDLRAEVYEVRDLGKRTFVRGCLRGQGAGSGAPIERTTWLAVEWRDKKIVWWCSFGSEAEALEAARLRESAMMSQENVDLAKRAFDAYNRRDLAGLEAIHHPNVELDWSASHGFVAGLYRGFDDFQRFWTGYFDAFEEITAEPERFIDAGESVVVPNVAHMRGRDGIEVSARSAIVFTFRSHRITRICLYQETDAALKAVGLEG